LKKSTNHVNITINPTLTTSINMTTPKILAFAGSTRTESFNKKIVKIAAQAARNADAEVTYIDLRDYPLPLFDEDLETASGLPENARKLKELMWENQGLLIASPEYNSSYSAVLKNTIDWISRPGKNDEQMLSCFAGKIAAIMSASPGSLGGLRGLANLRSLLNNISILVIPEQVTISHAFDAFNYDGSLKDSNKQIAVEQLGVKVASFLSKIHA
jgi:chromate reductase, NAD(P)H dehydrogenase (quinone)